MTVMMGANNVTTRLNQMAFRILMDQPVGIHMISSIAAFTSSIVASGGPKDGGRELASGVLVPTLESFMSSIMTAMGISFATLAGAAVYLVRLKQLLPSDAGGPIDVAHRIFTACLIIAEKYLNDECHHNKSWAECSKNRIGGTLYGYGLKDLEVMEREMLGLLGWDLRIRQEDLFRVFENFLAPIRSACTWNCWTEDCGLCYSMLARSQGIHSNLLEKKKSQREQCG